MKQWEQGLFSCQGTVRAISVIVICATLFFLAPCNVESSSESINRKVIIFVWDGLRPDSISATTTPNLWNLSKNGVFFNNNHATYPTFTMMNSSSFSTGDFPDKVGFYGNTVYVPRAAGNNAAGTAVDYNQPVFTEDWSVLLTLNSFYNDELFMVKRLLQVAQDKGKTTAIVGKSGAAFMFDLDRKGYGIDENAIFPQSLAGELQSAGYALPKNTPVMWPDIRLLSSNGDPTAIHNPVELADSLTSDPSIGTTSTSLSSNKYMMDIYLQYMLPKKNPDISVIWFRDPDTTEHLYGVGSKAYLDALNSMDTMLGHLAAQLKSLNQYDNTDIIVVSDHGHNNVSGDLSLFPLRTIANGAIGNTGVANGYSVSGDVRLAQLLADNGIVTNIYDGNGYSYDPVISGIMADGTQVYPDQTDTDGSVTGTIGKKYTTRGFKVPATLPAGSVVIAANGGSDYLYISSKDTSIVKKIVTFLQQREEFGAIFVDDRYGSIPGAIAMSMVHLENTAGRNPDIIVSYNFNENAVIQGVKGIEYESMHVPQTYRGMHGSFSPIDVNNTLITSGPDFRAGITSVTPSGNIDVAPTVAYLMGLDMPNTDGRVLYEALKNTSVTVSAVSLNKLIQSDAAAGLTFYKPTAILNSRTKIDSGKSRYSITLSTSTVTDSTGKSVTYFDYARAIRQ
ncbi:MAG: alkaline phosphatase family protein [Dissulfurispiraceae bacterium]|jgi:predicted AlkP superfamily pyrophosphatase or phosphodiesterase